MTRMEIEWRESKTDTGSVYFSGLRSEFCIFKDGERWVLKYTDFWSVKNEAFMVTIKAGTVEMFAVPALRRYAQMVANYYNENY